MSIQPYGHIEMGIYKLNLQWEFTLMKDGGIQKAKRFTNMKAVANKIFSDTNIAEDVKRVSVY